jgi:hypothetical protein
MTWRTNTQADKPGHRHEDSRWGSGWGESRFIETEECPPEVRRAWVPSDGYSEPPTGWGVFVFYVLAGLGVVCAVAWAIREVLQ